MSERPPPTPDPAAEPGWRPRTTSATVDVARYSQFVGYMRIGLPALAGILVVLVFVIPQFMGDDDRFRVGNVTAPLKNVAADALSMVNARYFGTDQKGQPFSVTAKGVKERPAPDERVDLVSPQADITLAGGDWLSIEAGAGLYDRKTETLDLSNEVSLFQDKGYEMHTAAASIRLKEGSASSRTPVQSQGPFGELVAQGFELSDKGENVLFLGPATLTLKGSMNAGRKP
jgi:lipopolysaccharide export system protein LptC